MMKRLMLILTAVTLGASEAAWAQPTNPFAPMLSPTNYQFVAPGGSKFWDSNAPLYKLTLNWLNMANWSNGNASTLFSSGTIPEARSAHTLTNPAFSGTIVFDTFGGYNFLTIDNAPTNMSMHFTSQQNKIIMEPSAGFEVRGGAPIYGNGSGVSNATMGLMNVLKVTDFGANVADGLDDSLAVSNALWSATNGAAGGNIFFPNGTAITTNPIYIVDSPLLGPAGASFQNSKVSFRGASRAQSVLQFNNVTNKFGILANTGMPGLRDISIVGNNSPGSIGFYSTNNGYPSPMQNIYMSGWDVAMKFDPLAGGELSSCTLNNNRIGLSLPGYDDVWRVSIRGDNNGLATLITGGPTLIDGTITRTHAGLFTVDGVANKYLVIAGKGFGNQYSASSEQGVGPVVAIGHPPVFFPGQTDDFVGTTKLNNFYAFDNAGFSNITTLTRVGTTATATIPAALCSNLFVGQAMTIGNVTPSGYNGVYQITAKPSTTTITYTMASDPGSSGAQADGTGMKIYPNWPYAELYAPPSQLIIENGSPGNAVIVHSATNTADNSIISLHAVDVRAMAQGTTNGAIFMTSTGARIGQSDANETFNGQINGSWEYYNTAVGTNVIAKINSNGIYSTHSASLNFEGNGRNLTNMLSASVSDFGSAAVNAAGTYQYDIDASNYFARAGSTMTFAEKLLVNQLVINGKANGWWTNCEAIYPFRGGTSASCAQNLKQNAFNITWSGAVTFGSNGVTAASSNSQGDTGFLPSVNGGASAIVKQNSMHIYVFNRTANPSNVANDGCAFMGTYGNNNTKAYIEHNGNGSTTLFGNGPNGQVSADSDTVLSGISSYYGHIMATRTTANATALYFNALSNTGSSSSTALPDLNVVLFRRGPSDIHIYNGTLAFATIGGGMSAAQYTAFKTDIDAYVTGASNLVTQAGRFMPRDDVQSSSTAVYAAGTAASFTASAALLTFGTTSPSLTITNAGTYLIQAHAQLRYNAATYDATVGRTATIKLRRTNNTAADLSNASRSINLRPSITTLTDNAGTGVVPPVLYTATAGDVVELWGSVSATPSAGAVDATSAEIVVLKIY